MLGDYELIEPLMYRQMKSNLIALSHAYLFNLNGNVYSMDMINSFIKAIVCGTHDNTDDYNNCKICTRINDGNYTDIKHIYPDGLYIKKESLDELQKVFSTKSIESGKRIYVIHDADRLNKSSANSLLKFLEEPADGIIAILVTNNINQIMDTITSRCRILTFDKNKVEDYIKYNNITSNVTLNKLAFTIWKINYPELISDEHEHFVDNIIKYIDKYEATKIKMILFTKAFFHDIFKEKEDILKFFECLILFYRDVLIYKINGQVMYYDDYKSLIEKVEKGNSMSNIINKLEVLMKCNKLIVSNVNINLLIDRMIIDMEVLQ